jgi:hypothetical protein
MRILLLALPMLALLACTEEGTTPDCTGANAGKCGAVVTGDAGAGGDSGDGASDAAAEASPDAPTDAPADAPDEGG